MKKKKSSKTTTSKIPLQVIVIQMIKAKSKKHAKLDLFVKIFSPSRKIIINNNEIIT